MGNIRRRQYLGGQKDVEKLRANKKMPARGPNVVGKWIGIEEQD